MLKRLSNNSPALGAERVASKAVHWDREKVGRVDRGSRAERLKERDDGTDSSTVSVLLSLSSSPIAAAPSSPMLL